MTTDQPCLVIVCGPTAVGKTRAAITLAKELNCEIISADARQFYSELKIGTAPPSSSELKQIRHHLIGHLSVKDPYNIGIYEKDALLILDRLFRSSRFAVVVGGSGLYLHALCHGLDLLPEHDQQVREEINRLFQSSGVTALQEKLKVLDHDYYEKVDLSNPARLIRAIEVSLISGKPYSSFRKQAPQTRPFRIIKTGLDLPREELYRRIDRRVDEMIWNGLLEEARSMLPFRSFNALNTVGYKEFFEYFDGKLSLEEAIILIKQHTRNYAKRQLTWFRRDNEITWFHPEDVSGILKLVTRHS
ncbi:MAG: tRNA (adenosine(37)-N6)-dimethylallyltransferase MiaA [bacterium]